MHPGPLEAGFHHQLVRTLHRAAADGVAQRAKLGIAQLIGPLGQILQAVADHGQGGGRRARAGLPGQFLLQATQVVEHHLRVTV